MYFTELILYFNILCAATNHFTPGLNKVLSYLTFLNIIIWCKIETFGKLKMMQNLCKVTHFPVCTKYFLEISTMTGKD